MAKAKPKTTKVTCKKCDTASAVLASSVEKDRDTTWQCPHCGHANTIPAK